MAFAYTNQTNFRPFSYQEMLAPVLQATQAQQELEDAYGELGTQADTIAAMADATTDPIAYQRYKTFENQLRQQADTLSREGLNIGSRKALNNIKNFYAKQITPIANAVQRRRALADEQRKASLTDRSLRYQRNFNQKSYDTSLDRFLENPDYDYGQFVSGKDIEAEVATAAKNLAQELHAYGQGKRLDPYTKTFLQRYGLTSEEVRETLANPNSDKSNKVLAAIVDSAMVSSGVRNWADANTIREMAGYAARGAMSAVGTSKVSTFEDYGARLAAQAAQKKKDSAADTFTGGGINPVPFYNMRDLNAKQKKYQKNIKDYSKYFYKNAKGDYVMTNAGWNKYWADIEKAKQDARVQQATAASRGLGTKVEVKVGKTPYVQFMNSIGFNPEKRGDRQDASAALSRGGKAFEEYVSNNPDKAALGDAQKNWAWDYAMKSTGEAQQSYKNAILKAYGGQDLIEVDYDAKTNTFKSTGKTLSREDFENKDTYVTHTRYGAYTDKGKVKDGNVVFVKDAKGNLKTYKLPPGVNPTAEKRRDEVVDEALKAQQQLLRTDLTPQQRIEWQNKYNSATQEAQAYHSQLWYVNDTKDQQYEVFDSTTNPYY